MGLDLAHGGHLTHGSRFNISGKTYRVCSYGVDEKTRRLNYARIRAQALEWRPRLIIGGASSYPWDFDWKALRGIADAVGAFLLADVAHLAGLIAAGVLANPLPHAHVVTFTTHKTLCGPRGAVILSSDPDIARRLDEAVFPGLQGGPHVNSIAAIGRLFEVIQEDPDGFRAFERRIVENARFFADCLVEQGLALEYGGTNTHMLLVDLKRLPVDGEAPLDGETASRLLELGGIVCNKNVLPGDPDGAHASGIRLGLPWLTQRGVTKEQLREIASIVKAVLGSVRTFTIWSPTGDLRCRGRVPFGLLAEAAGRSRAIAEALPYPPRPTPPARPPAKRPLDGRAVLLLQGGKVRLALSEMLTARLPLERRAVRARMLRADGAELDDVIALALETTDGAERWLLLPRVERAATVRRWIEELSDGYLLFDPGDLQAKVDGPTVVSELDATELPAEVVREIRAAPPAPSCDLTKPYFIGQDALYRASPPEAKPTYSYAPRELPLRRTVLNELHRDLGAKMVPFAGWEMPVHYPAGILAEHRAVRTAAGLFDVSHMSAIEVKGRHALAFLETVMTNCVSRLAPGQAEYSLMLYPDGTAVDDLFIYRLERERFMVVVNAANAERVKDWLRAVNERRVAIDLEMPGKEADGPVVIRDLRAAGDDSLVGLALQGPASLRVLSSLASDSAGRAAIGRLRQSSVARVTLAGADAWVARTGYTGELVGFEIYVHPDHAPVLWHAILEAGRPLGVLPAGLGARDSTRIEAGYPLFGHELEGDLNISMTEAGYGWAARLHVPFFVGRRPHMERARRSRRHLVRLRGQGRKTVRPGHAILDDSGKVAGQVTSFAYAREDMTYYVLACVEEAFDPQPGETVVGVRTAPHEVQGPIEERRLVELTALTRFAEREEREAWRERYAI